MASRRVHVFVSGLVQGVNFRFYTRQQARLLGLKGWVRNTPDGRVEAVFEGEGALVDRMLEWCHHGPPSAGVDGVETVWEDATGSLEDFDIVR
jgi:acylphosphatase